MKKSLFWYIFVSKQTFLFLPYINTMFDLGIIGGGPAGYTAAEHAARLGMTVVLFEKGAVGGVCLNEGCIPTKALLYSAKTFENARSAAKYGVQTGEVEFDYNKIIARKNKIIRKLNAGIRAKLNQENITYVAGEAIITEANKKSIKIKCNDETAEVRFLLICTGSSNTIPPIPGLAETDYWTSREALASDELPGKLAIIGGGVIGIEFAAFFNTLGVDVAVVEMQDEILGNTDREISRFLREELTKKGVKFYPGCKITEVKENKLFFEKEGVTESLSVERILVSTGRKPNTGGIGLENTSVELSSAHGIITDKHMKTSAPHIFAAGDVTGCYMLAHTAVREAEVAVNYIHGEYDSMLFKAIPSVVYTNPEVASVGETEESLKEKDIPYKVLKLPMSYSGRFVAENEGGTGFCKIIANEDEQIVGIHLAGNSSSEIITLATLAIETGMTISKWQRSVFPHPTVSEIIKETLNTFEPEPII